MELKGVLVMSKIHADTFIAPTADIVGDVTIGEGSSVWYHAVLRGDMAPIMIGKNSNIQDGCLLHVAEGFPLQIGNYVTAGHGAILHGCTVEDGVLIGMGAIVLDGAVIGSGSIIGAGAVIPEGKVIPPRSLVVGVPGKVIRELDEAKAQELIAHAEKYARLGREYREQGE
ncbi:MAG: gamma carbonic anhydrase family protein [Firmicutes bacterium]|nr:gamma carbonic anhydrase family protein [Bacillota bacterium]